MYKPQTELRARGKFEWRSQTWTGQVLGPPVVVDNHLYNSPSTLRAARSEERWREIDVIGTPYWVGENSDVLIDPSDPYSLPAASWPMPWYIYSWYDPDRDLHWLTNPPVGLPLWGRDPFAEHWVPFPSNALTGDKLELRYAFNCDSVTKNYKYWRDRGTSIHNQCLKGTVIDDGTLTVFVKATKWNTVRDLYGLTRYTSISDTKYLRIDVVGGFAALLATVTPARLAGYTVSPDDESIPADIASCSLRNFLFQLEQYRVAAMGKANRGVMDLAVTLFELPKTIKLVRNMLDTLRRIERIAATIKGLNRKKQVPVAELSKLWLELRYGYRQLYFDGRSLADVYLAFRRKVRRSYVSGNSRSGQWLSTDNQYIVLDTGGFTIQWEGNFQLRAGVAADVNADDKWYKKLYQFVGGINPLSVAYETMKLSWILDWWHNFGALISALGRDPARFIRAWHTAEMSEQPLNVVSLRDVQISHTAILRAIGNFDRPWTSMNDWGDLCPYSGHLVKTAFNNDEEVLTWNAVYLRASLYHRVPVDPTRFPLVVPKGTGIRGLGQVADMLSLFTKSKPRGL